MKNIPKKLFITIFFLLVISPLIFSSIVGYYFVFNSNTSKQYKEEIVDYTINRLEPLSRELNETIKNASKDILFISQLSSVKELTTNNKSIATAKQDFASFLEKNRAYYKLQYVGKSGEEIVNMQYLNNQYEKTKLENVKNESYFKKILELNTNEIYISNIEFNSMDTATNSPTSIVKIGIPLTNKNNEKIGILALSLSTDELLNEIIEYSRDNEETVFLVDQQGNYLAYPDKLKAPSFYAREKLQNFFNEYPEFKKDISSSYNKGSLEQKDKIFVYQIIYPTISTPEIYRGSEKIWGKNSENNFYWILVSESSRSVASEHSANFQYISFVILVGGGAMVIILLVFCFILKFSGKFFQEMKKIKK